MFEVQYPEIGQYDGKVHSIEIEKAFIVNNGSKKYILVYGEEKGRIIPLVLQYMEDIKEYVYIPCSKMELLSITSPILDREEITEELIEKLRGKRIKSLLDVNVEQIINNNNITDKTNNSITVEGKIDYQKEELKEDDWDEFIEMFQMNKKKSLNLLSQFYIDNKGKYNNHNIEINILKLINDLLNVVQAIPYTIFTEDDLIDLGSLLQKLNYIRVNRLKDEEIHSIINSGYELYDNISLRKESITK